MRDGSDDDQLFGALREAMRARRAIPIMFVQTATNVYAWHNIDAELARLNRDRDRGPDL